MIFINNKPRLCKFNSHIFLSHLKLTLPNSTELNKCKYPIIHHSVSNQSRQHYKSAPDTNQVLPIPQPQFTRPLLCHYHSVALSDTGYPSIPRPNCLDPQPLGINRHKPSVFRKPGRFASVTQLSRWYHTVIYQLLEDLMGSVYVGTDNWNLCSSFCTAIEEGWSIGCWWCIYGMAILFGYCHREVIVNSDVAKKYLVLCHFLLCLVMNLFWEVQNSNIQEL